MNPKQTNKQTNKSMYNTINICTKLWSKGKMSNIQTKQRHNVLTTKKKKSDELIYLIYIMKLLYTKKRNKKKGKKK